jgi:SAM-dependent methyltransferase
VLAAVRGTIETVLTDLDSRLQSGERKLLDVGCWDAEATVRYAARVHASPYGIEIFEKQAAQARARGVEVATLNLETDRFPWADGSMDIVVANQVFEHLKNVWLAMSEIARVLRPDGYFVISVPNLASLHNRLLLMIGRQPTSIRVLGPHVRGFTPHALQEFVELGECLAVERTLGVGFYPFPTSWTRPVTSAWCSASHTLVLVARRRASSNGSPWLRYVEQATASGLQTHY